MKKTHKAKKGKKKKKSVKRRIVRKKRPVKKKARTAKKPSKKRPKLPPEPLGRVTHYFPKARAAAVMIEREGLRVGDVLYFKGHTTRFKQTIDSLQINHQPVTEASPGDEVGIRVKARTREHDLVFRL